MALQASFRRAQLVTGPAFGEALHIPPMQIPEEGTLA